MTTAIVILAALVLVGALVFAYLRLRAVPNIVKPPPGFTAMVDDRPFTQTGTGFGGTYNIGG